MDSEIRSRIAGAFSGYNSGAIFRLANGQAWQQKRYRYRYKYVYRSEVRIYQDGGQYMMEVAGMEDDPIQVTRVQIAAEGPIVSDFSGFNQDMQFQFQNGQIWQQAEYKYSYHYAYRPNAIVVNGIGGDELQVDGLSETVRVRRIR